MASRGRSGGNFYETLSVRVSMAFAHAVISSTLERHTSYTDAFQMLGFKKTSTFHGLADRLGVAMTAYLLDTDVFIRAIEPSPRLRSLSRILELDRPPNTMPGRCSASKASMTSFFPDRPRLSIWCPYSRIAMFLKPKPIDHFQPPTTQHLGQRMLDTARAACHRLHAEG